MVVLAWSVAGAFVQVFWSSEYCHSYDARRDVALTTILTEPETGPAWIVIPLLG